MLLVMKIIFRGLVFGVLFCAFLSLFSCATRINGALAADGGAALSVSMALEPGITAVIRRSLAAAGGQTGNVLDGAAIAQSMSNAPGIALVSLRNTTPAAVEGQVRIYAIGEFLAAADGRGFINFEQGSSGGRCVINIDRSNGPEILELLSPQIVDLVNALMAPLATGEVMSKGEYLELVASFYNNTAISNEIADSRIRASIEFPGTVTSVRGGTFSGRTANLDIPLIDLLVLETPFICIVTWN